MITVRNKDDKHLGVHINNEMHYKLHYIAKYEGRSGNGQILYLVNECIRKFEKEHGEIKVEVEEKK